MNITPIPTTTIVVVGVGGCGATVVAAALADTAQRFEPTTLIDLATPYGSGLVHGVDETELATTGGLSYILRGQRASGVVKLSPGVDDPSISERFFGPHRIPARGEWLKYATNLVVVDFAWNPLEVTQSMETTFADWISGAVAVVLVFPATLPGLARAESVANVLAAIGVAGFYTAISHETITPDFVTNTTGGALGRSMVASPPVAFPHEPDVYLKGANIEFPESIMKAAGALVAELGLK